MQGSGNINTQNIEADNATVTMQGTGRIRITATHNLTATLVRGNSNIYISLWQSTEFNHLLLWKKQQDEFEHIKEIVAKHFRCYTNYKR